MARFWNRRLQTVRPRSVRRVPLLLCLLVFGLSAVAVYRWGYEIRPPTDSKWTYTATACVVERTGPGGDEVRIPLAYTADDPGRAEQVANRLAECYVCDRQAERQRRTTEAQLKAREATVAARREHALRQAQLDQFRRQLAAAAKPQAAVQQPEPLPPPMIDNPRWIELEARRADLQRRRESLLVDRTPLHPAVQDLSLRIDQLQQQMASIPRQIPGNHTAPDRHLVAAQPPADDPTAQQDRAKLDELTAAAEQTRRACEDCETAEKLAMQERRGGPHYEVQNARIVEIPPPPEHGLWRLLAVALSTGVAMAIGVGAVSAGASIEPPVADAAAVQTASGAPVLGVIPADEPVPDPHALNRRLSHARQARIAIGLLLITAGPLLAAWGLAGI